MTHRVQVTRAAARQLAEGLPETVAAACVEFLYGPLAESPRRVGVPLRKPFERSLAGPPRGVRRPNTPSTRPRRSSAFWISATGGRPTGEQHR